MQQLKAWMTGMSRGLEYLLTGESNNTRNNIAQFELVSDRFKARLLEDPVRKRLWRRFGIYVQSPILFELFEPDKPPSPGEDCPAHGVVGYYRPHLLREQRTHLVFVVNNLTQARFKAVYAHELVHAWERETGVVTERVLREGLARWVEYKLLLEEGADKEADKVLNVSRWTWGKGVRIVLDIEQQVGEERVIETLREQSLARRA